MATTENNIIEDAQSAPQSDAPTENGSESTGTETNSADGTQDAKNSEANESDATEPTAKSKSGREAAKYRTQLRTAEAERDQLRGQLDTAREIILNNYLDVKSISLRAGGIQKLGYDTADLVNDDLSINADALNSTLQGITDSGFLFQDKTEGVVSKSGTGIGKISGDGPSWGNVLGNND